MSFPAWPNIGLCGFSIELVSAIEVQLRPF